jgi:hypothetical protein
MQIILLEKVVNLGNWAMSSKSRMATLETF